MEASRRQGCLFVVSAPSGTGKTTLVEKLVAILPGLTMSRSYTERAPRPGEVDGVDYNFVEASRFSTMVEAGAFLEWATIFGHRYGTGRDDLSRQRQDGQDVVMVIDVQGAQQVRDSGVEMVGIFVLPPSFHELEQRLRRRSGTHATEAELRTRLDTARREVEAVHDYDHVVVNETVDQAVDDLRSIVTAQRTTPSAAAAVIGRIVETFRHDR